MNIKRHIPNAITCCNLLCGCLALVNVFDGHFIWASYLVGLAAVFDFFDGFAARLLHVSSAIGKDLDSLADMVTFGVVPGMMIYKLVIEIEHTIKEYNYILEKYSWVNYLVFLMIIFSAIRLAKFNNDPRQSDSFIGVPTPANAIFWCSFPFLDVSFLSEIFMGPYFIIGGTLIFSFLLVSEISLFALKFKHFKWRENEIRYLFLSLSFILLVWFQYLAIPIIIMLYIALSLLAKVVKI